MWFVNHLLQVIVFFRGLTQWPANIDSTVESFDEAINEISAALDLLEKLLNYSWERHRVDSADLNRGGEHILRLIRASFNVR